MFSIVPLRLTENVQAGVKSNWLVIGWLWRSGSGTWRILRGRTSWREEPTTRCTAHLSCTAGRSSRGRRSYRWTYTHTHTHTHTRLWMLLLLVFVSSHYLTWISHSEVVLMFRSVCFFPSCLSVRLKTLWCLCRRSTVNRRAAWWRIRLAAAQNPSLWVTMTSSLTSPPFRPHRASSSPRPETASSKSGSEDERRQWHHTHTHTHTHVQVLMVWHRKSAACSIHSLQSHDFLLPSSPTGVIRSLKEQFIQKNVNPSWSQPSASTVWRKNLSSDKCRLSDLPQTLMKSPHWEPNSSAERVLLAPAGSAAQHSIYKWAVVALCVCVRNKTRKLTWPDPSEVKCSRGSSCLSGVLFRSTTFILPVDKRRQNKLQTRSDSRVECSQFCFCVIFSLKVVEISQTDLLEQIIS